MDVDFNKKIWLTSSDQHGIPRTAATTERSRDQELANIERYKELTDKVNKKVAMYRCFSMRLGIAYDDRLLSETFLPNRYI